MEGDKIVSSDASMPVDNFQDTAEYRQPRYWLVPGENLAQILEIMQPVHEASAHMTEQEINDIIDEALTEVRSER